MQTLERKTPPAEVASGAQTIGDGLHGKDSTAVYPTTPLEHALAYADMGLCVLPLHTMVDGRCSCGRADCPSPAKHPRTGHGAKDASADPDVIRAWWGMWPVANVGVTLSGLAVVDVDPRNGGDATLDDLTAKHGKLPDTVTALTGGGGQHYVYRDPGRTLPGTLGPGIDFKHGANAYIVVAPSNHASGGRYEWEASSDPLNGAAIAELPEWIGTATTTTTSDSATPAGARSTQALVQEFMAANNLHDASTSIAFRLVDDGMQPGKVVEMLRGCMQAMPDKGDMARWRARYNDIPRAVDGAVQKLATAVKPALDVVNLQGFMQRKPRPVRYAVEPIVPLRLTTLLAADGGVGKSSLALAMAAAFAAGQPCAGFDTAGGHALFVSLEDEASIVETRLQRIVTAYGLDAARVAANLCLVDGTDGDGALACEVGESGVKRLVFTANMKRVEELAEGAALIVVDNASDAFDADENSRRLVRAFVRKLTQIARKQDAGVLLLAHVNKDTAKYGGRGASYSGSTAWNASVRSRLALVRSGAGIELIHEKANHAAKADPVAFRFTDEGVLLATQGASPIASLLDAQDDKALINTLGMACARGGDIFPNRSSAYNAHAMLTNFGLPDALRKDKARFYRSLDRLLAADRVTVDEYMNAQSKPRKRLVVAADSPRSCSPIPPIESAGADAPRSADDR